jgi:predicted DCC family thiol-disulfide oxidoreductase YuxK
VPDTTGPVMFFDGGCGLCHNSVRLLIRLDRKGKLTFAPLGGELFGQRVPEETRAGLPDSLVLSTPDGKLHVRSNAVLRALEEIGGIWTYEAKLGRLIPAALRDRLYDAIARARHRWFKKPETVCPLMPPELRGRFRD